MSKSNYNLRTAFRALAMIFIMSSPLGSFAFADSFDVLTDDSLGEDAIEAGMDSYFTTSSITALVDGTVTAMPTGSVTYDRTLVNATRFMGNINFSPVWSFRWNVLAQLSMRVEEGKDVPRTIVKEKWVEARPRLEFTYKTQNSLEVFFGLSYFVIPRYERKTSAVDVESVTSYQEVAIPIPHIGLVKRSGSVDGGFSYKLAAEKSREVRKVNNQDDSKLVFDEEIHDPTTITIFGRFQRGRYRVFGEFAAVQAGEGGNTTENGDTVREDYTRSRLELQFPLWRDDMDSELTVVHKMLSYADNRSVTLPTMPMFGVHLKLLIGQPNLRSFLGIVYLNGRDGQSLPEFNATYKVDGFGASAGLNIRL